LKTYRFRWYPALQKAADRAFDKSKSLEIEGELHADRFAKRKLFSPNASMPFKNKFP
jgi:hypothetical protein